MDILRAPGESGTTLLVTHDNRILELADGIVTSKDGRITRNEAQATREATSAEA